MSYPYSTRRILRQSPDGRILRYAAMHNGQEVSAHSTRGAAAAALSRLAAKDVAAHYAALRSGPRIAGTLSLVL